jgi:hypothetical protein
MSLGDISFIAAFIVLPLVIVVLSVMALRTLNQRQRRPLARFSADNPAESTQELPIAERREPRDWAAAVQPTRGPAADEVARPYAPTQSFKVPSYHGRTKGVVRRMTFRPRPLGRVERADAQPEADQSED